MKQPFSFITQIPLYRLVLLVILLLAFGLRVWGLDFGLPNISRPDEQNISHIVMTNLLNSIFQGHPDLNPHFFEYPSLHLYLLSLLYGIYYLVGHLLGLFPNGQAFIEHYLDNFYTFHLISRWVSVLMGTLTVWAVYGLAKDLSNSRMVGLSSAFLMAIAYLHVRDSHFGVTDVPVTLWVTLSLWLSLRYLKTDRKAFLRGAAITAGLAASTKYPGGIALFSLYLACLLNRKSGFPIKDLGYATVWTLGAFLITSPFILINFSEFWRGFTIQRDHMRDGHYLDLGMGWIYHLRYSLWNGLGPLYLLTALLGTGMAAVHSFRSKESSARAHWLLLLFLIFYYVLIGATKTVFIRYIIPVLPLLAVYAGWMLHQAVQWFSVKLKGSFSMTALMILLTAGVAGTSIQQSIRFDSLLRQPDTRNMARAWLLSHLAYIESVGIGMPLAHIDLPQRYRRFYLTIPEGHADFGKLYRAFYPLQRQEVDLTPVPHGELKITSYRDVKLLQKLGIRYVVVSKTPLTLFNIPDFELQPIMHQFRLVAHFSPLQPNAPGPSREDFDQLDAFYVPFRNFDGMRRPGPELFIYEVPSGSVP